MATALTHYVDYRRSHLRKVIQDISAGLQAGRWNRFEMHITNKGNWHARNVTPIVTGPVEVQGLKAIEADTRRSSPIRRPSRSWEDMAAQVRRTCPTVSAAESRPTSNRIHPYLQAGADPRIAGLDSEGLNTESSIHMYWFYAEASSAQR